jgi:hypothetical protein
MSNRWGIPIDVEELVLSRDTNCVYCGIEFKVNPKTRRWNPSWEHIINDIRINGPDNIALCCISCNASKGAKKIEDWFDSDYCIRNRINLNTVAQVVKEAIKNSPKAPNS